MVRLLRILLVITAGFLSIPAYAQEGLSVAPFFTEAYSANRKLTSVTITGDRCGKMGLTVYKSITVSDDVPLADKIRRAVAKDGAAAKSKEVSYREGQLYFGLYSMGGKEKGRRYLIFLNRRPAGTEKTTLIFIEGDVSEEMVKKLIKN